LAVALAEAESTEIITLTAMAVPTNIAAFAETGMVGVWPAWHSTHTIATMVTATAGLRVSNPVEGAFPATSNARSAAAIKTIAKVVGGPSRCTTRAAISATACRTNTSTPLNIASIAAAISLPALHQLASQLLA
jgi:hypothetical protein